MSFLPRRKVILCIYSGTWDSDNLIKLCNGRQPTGCLDQMACQLELSGVFNPTAEEITVTMKMVSDDPQFVFANGQTGTFITKNRRHRWS